MAFIGTVLAEDQLVLTRGRDFKWSFENLDDSEPPQPVDFPAGDLYFELDTGGETNALQRVSVTAASGGTYKLGFKGVLSTPIDYYDAVENPHGIDGDITDALEGISTIGAGNVFVSPAKLVPVWKVSLNLNQGHNEIQQITFTGNPTGGNFKLGYGFGMTDKISFGADGPTVKAALEALPDIGAGNVSVNTITNGYQVEFIGTKSNTNMQQLQPYAYGIFLDFGLTGGIFPSMRVNTLVDGSAKLTEPLVNTINKTVNDFFNSFETLLGVDLDYEVHDDLNMTLTITSIKSYTESDLITFAVDVTSNGIESFLNGVAQLTGLFQTINVDFYWNHEFDVEFVGDLELSPQPELSVDYSELTGLDNEQKVEVTVPEEGKERFTKWPFTVASSTATIKVESEDADLIQKGVRWQLVFLPDGEPAGGDAVARGQVREQR